MVDLGLSVKWATYNMGATAPEEAGNFYAYGETEPKEEYSLETYQWYYPDYNDWDCDEWEKYYRLGTTIRSSEGSSKSNFRNLSTRAWQLQGRKN